MIIQTNDLSFSYGKQEVLDKINIEVPKNSIYGFLGPNGAGKSTTIKLLLGLLNSKEGSVRLFDKSFQTNRNEILNNTGSLIESPTIYRNLTAKENLEYINKIYRKENSRIEEVLRIIGLWKHRNKRAKNFSTGMKQRMGIGMAIFHNPDLVILDEPLNGLDPKGVFEVRELLLNLQDEGKTIFISSHFLSEIEKICSHVGIIKNGSLIFQGEIDLLTSKASHYVDIKTSNNVNAIKLFAQHNLIIKTKIKSIIEIQINTKDDFNRMIHILIDNDIKIYDIEKKTTNLEEIFINLTSN